MAEKQQLEILRQGVEVWNKWRDNNPNTNIDLDDANLVSADLRGANLVNALLRSAHLFYADLSETNFREADLTAANLGGARLDKANLRLVNLQLTDLSRASLIETDITGAVVGKTLFSDIDLGQTIGLDVVFHLGPSTIGVDTLQRSKGKIPAAFLRGCGLSDFEIESAKLYNPDLNNQEIDEILYRIHDLRAHQPLQISPLFISYSLKDKAFVDHLDGFLKEKGIRFWRDIHDAKAGRLEKQIDQAIRQNPTMLLVLSKNSLQSDWVEHEVREARALEKELKRDVLCPIALDGSWKNGPWPERLMEQVMEYNILDFSRWEDEKVFRAMFVKLIDGLQLFYKR